jgi:uncharacterized protein (TIGR02118 family)
VDGRDKPGHDGEIAVSTPREAKRQRALSGIFSRIPAAGFALVSPRRPQEPAMTGRNALATVLVLYKTPADPAAFDRYYAETHIPLAKKIPGVRSYTISKGAVATPAGASNIHLVATLAFDSFAALQAGLGSPEGAAAAADLPNFASGGVDLYMFEDGPA